MSEMGLPHMSQQPDAPGQLHRRALLLSALGGALLASSSAVRARRRNKRHRRNSNSSTATGTGAGGPGGAGGAGGSVIVDIP
jgi:hypothetical protein